MTSDRSYVAPDSFLTLHYRLSGPGGDIINTFGDKPATLSLGTGELSPAVEQCLVGMEEGARAVFELPAGVAFGERQADRVQWVARSLLDQLGENAEVYQVGDVVQFPTPDGLGSYAGAVLRVGAGAMAASGGRAKFPGRGSRFGISRRRRAGRERHGRGPYSEAGEHVSPGDSRRFQFS